VRVRGGSNESAACPLCRDPVPGPEAYACPGCAVVYHRDCVDELGGCGTLGCAEAGKRRREVAPAAPAGEWRRVLPRARRPDEPETDPLLAGEVLRPLGAALVLFGGAVVFARGLGPVATLLALAAGFAVVLAIRRYFALKL